MKFNTQKTAAVLFAALFVAVSAPALAGGDYLHYEPSRASYNKPDHFDVDVRTANGQKYEVEVNAKTGAVISSKLDD